MNFGETLRRILKDKGIMQKELAEMIGARPDTVGGWINGVKEPSLHYVYEVCMALNVTPNDLLGFSQLTLGDYCTDELLAELKRRTIKE